jgi:hypothetical protein
VQLLFQHYDNPLSSSKRWHSKPSPTRDIPTAPLDSNKPKKYRNLEIPNIKQLYHFWRKLEERFDKRSFL